VHPMEAPITMKADSRPTLQTALLIEDNAGDALLIKAMLAEAAFDQYCVVHAERLERGIALLGEQPDIVLLDLSLPDSTGLDTFRTMLAHAPELPVIVLTGLSDRNMALKALDEGAQDYLVKDEVTSAGLVKAMNYAVTRKQAETRLRESEHRYKALFESAPDAILLIRSGEIVDTNSQAGPLFGTSRECLLGQPLGSLSAVRQPAGSQSPLSLGEHLSLAQQRGSHFFEWCFQDAGGAPLYTEVNLDSVYLEGEHHMLAIVRDLRERMQAEEQIRFQASMLNQVRNAVIATDTRGNIVYWNRYASALHHFEPEQALGKNAIRLLLAARNRHLVGEVRTALEQTSHWEGEAELCRHGGVAFPAHLTLSPVRDTGDRLIGFVGIAVDISERKEIERKLAHSAFHDTLTGLPNRALFYDRLSRAIARGARSGQRYAVMLMDMDGFKLVNDSLGHLVGDELLVQFARRVESCLRPGDTLARLGGDEFTILLEDIKHSADAVRVAERIHEQMAHPFRLAGNEVFSSTSIGITFSSPTHQEPSHALRDADTAMYRAKEQGKGGHVIFEAGMHERAVSQLRRETELRRALERDELTVEFQPIIELGTGLCVGCEAFARWNHPMEATIKAREFMQVAEETGMIIPIGQKILEQACGALAHWQRRFALVEDFSLHINLSRKQFAHRDTPGMIADALAAHDLSGSSLTVEIAERALAEDPFTAAAVLGDLRELDVRVCIDDFGTGNSSLGYLQRFPVDTVKIPQPLVQDLGKNITSSAIVGALLGLAQNLGMDVIAEGVETTEHEHHLLQLGCRNGQGFLFFPPMDEQAMEAHLQLAMAIRSAKA
jgi:diguanylate cyclase (GGDEF)-like protein/PAS domain S-box-containing protein